MPVIRSFRALRFRPEVVGDLANVVSPPYDVISPSLHAELLLRDPHNVVRLDLPGDEPGDEPDDRYRRAARTIAAWRSEGALHKDPRPGLYVYEQAYRVPGSDVERIQRGFFGRLRLEPFGPEGGVLPHERTMSGPKEDRYKLLCATGVNTSPVVGLYADPSGEAAQLLATVTALPAEVDIVDDDGVRHRLWVVPDDADSVVPALIARAGAGSITIADGHHRYETSLRYRDERRMTRSCEEDPAFDYVLTLFLEATSQPLTVLPTHRIVRGLGEDGVERLCARAGELFSVRDGLSAAELVAEFGEVDPGSGGRGRFGLWTRAGGGAVLEARRAAFSGHLQSGGPAVGRLDVSLLGVALDLLAGIDAAALAGGERVGYTKSAAEAIASVDAGSDGADAAFLLEPTPVASVIEVAADGDVMPQKSTYFFPKPLTGLVINPHEW